MGHPNDVVFIRRVELVTRVTDTLIFDPTQQAGKLIYPELYMLAHERDLRRRFYPYPDSDDPRPDTVWLSLCQRFPDGLRQIASGGLLGLCVGGPVSDLYVINSITVEPDYRDMGAFPTMHGFLQVRALMNLVDHNVVYENDPDFWHEAAKRIVTAECSMCCSSLCFADPAIAYEIDYMSALTLGGFKARHLHDCIRVRDRSAVPLLPVSPWALANRVMHIHSLIGSDRDPIWPLPSGFLQLRHGFDRGGVSGGMAYEARVLEFLHDTVGPARAFLANYGCLV